MHITCCQRLLASCLLPSRVSEVCHCVVNILVSLFVFAGIHVPLILAIALCVSQSVSWSLYDAVIMLTCLNAI